MPIALVIVLLMGCNDTKNSRYTNQLEVKKATAKTSNNHPGKKLMQNKCYVCHNPTTGHKGRIAPPMVAVKSHYLKDDTTKEAFSNAIWDFVKKPNPYKTKMQGAVNRFGLMPYQEFKEEDIKQIAEYIYDNKIDEPEWFKEHLEEEPKGNMTYQNEDKN